MMKELDDFLPLPPWWRLGKQRCQSESMSEWIKDAATR